MRLNPTFSIDKNITVLLKGWCHRIWAQIRNTSGLPEVWLTKSDFIYSKVMNHKHLSADVWVQAREIHLLFVAQKKSVCNFDFFFLFYFSWTTTTTTKKLTFKPQRKTKNKLFFCGCGIRVTFLYFVSHQWKRKMGGGKENNLFQRSVLFDSL